jgi:hypothetical protein
MRCTLALALLLALAGCQSGDRPYPRDDVDAALFGPAAMRIHPIFTRLADWTGDGVPDGIEALIELQDQFGDPTKASGTIIFELYSYRKYSPDIRGDRLAVWTGSLQTLQDQKDHWNRTSRTYSFQLAKPWISATTDYVLSAQFDLAGGGRFFARTILEGQLPQPKEPASTQPATSPTTAPTSLPTTMTTQP